MVVNEPKKRRKSKQSKPRQLHERRFEPQKTRTQPAVAAVGMVGAAAFGAGLYARFVMEPTASYWYWLMVPGAALVSAALFWGDQNEPVRVGDAGVAVEKNSEVVRLPWCDMKRIHVEGRTLVIDGEGVLLKIPMGAHPLASAWVLAEGMRRVPDAMDVKGSAADSLPKPGEKDGENLKVEDYQVAGRRCAASDQSIAFARDARLCPKCGQVFHRSHVPGVCSTCESKLTGRAISVPG